MKKRFLPFLLLLMSFLSISATTVYANHIATIPLSGSTGTCTFTGVFDVVDFSNAGSLEVSGVLVGNIYDTKGTPTTMDDVNMSVNQAISVAVNLDGTTCTTLNLSTEGLGVMSTCGNISLDVSDVQFTPNVSGGGKSNLITNSLCAIARYYDNGMKASESSLFAHVKNLVRALQR